LKRVLCCAFILFTLLSGLPAAEEPAPHIPEKARSADAFVDSLGVNVHLGYSDTVYYRFEELIKPKLLELGIRHVRDGLRLDRKDVIARLTILAENGIRSDLLVNPKEAVAIAKALKKSVLTVEGRNEPDHGNGWEAAARDENKALYAAIKADPETANIPVVVSGMANTRDSAAKLAASGLTSESLDFGNMHSYPGGLNPVSGGWGIPLTKAIEQERKVCGDKPIICTESGYHNRLEEKGHPGVSEAAAAKYLPRLFFTYFNRGIVRTFSYEFIDGKPDPKNEDIERHFGMLHNDGSPKPVFTAVKRLIALLKDPGEPLTPGALDYTLSGETKNVEHALLQKRDGRFFLVLWLEVVSFDTKAKQDLAVAPHEVVVKFAAPIAKVTIHKPSSATEPVATFAATGEIKVSVPDELLVIEIAPGK
jgi:hypothetical protein